VLSVTPGSIDSYIIHLKSEAEELLQGERVIWEGCTWSFVMHSSTELSGCTWGKYYVF